MVASRSGRARPTRLASVEPLSSPSWDGLILDRVSPKTPVAQATVPCPAERYNFRDGVGPMLSPLEELGDVGRAL
jgi:hypothetical protein